MLALKRQFLQSFRVGNKQNTLKLSNRGCVSALERRETGHDWRGSECSGPGSAPQFVCLTDGGQNVYPTGILLGFPGMCLHKHFAVCEMFCKYSL